MFCNCTYWLSAEARVEEVHGVHDRDAACVLWCVASVLARSCVGGGTRLR